MYRPDKTMAKAIWLSLVQNWTVTEGIKERIVVEGVKIIARIPAYNRYDLWLWSDSTAQHPRLRGRFYFGKL